MCSSGFSVRSILMSALVLTAVIGCGAGNGDGFSGDRGKVSGTITLDGAPLKEGCQVIFIASPSGYTASGVVNAEGKYTLAYSDSDGLPAVDYMVQLTAPIVADSTTTVDPMEMAAKMNLGKSKGKIAVDDTRPFPLMYESTTTSTLKFKVEPKDNVADFKLESAK